MGIRRIKKKERDNGMKYCTFCKPTKIDAIWRDARCSFACEKHKSELEDNSNPLTEADYQTWMKL